MYQAFYASELSLFIVLDAQVPLAHSQLMQVGCNENLTHRDQYDISMFEMMFEMMFE